jgi:hypothetical protein
MGFWLIVDRLYLFLSNISNFFSVGMKYFLAKIKRRRMIFRTKKGQIFWLAFSSR